MTGNGDERGERTLERIEAKLDRLVEMISGHSSRFASLESRIDGVESRLLKHGAVIDALGSKLDHARTEILLRLDNLRLELLQAAEDEARFMTSGQ
jgi:hypothetical protein